MFQLISVVSGALLVVDSKNSRQEALTYLSHQDGQDKKQENRKQGQQGSKQASQPQREHGRILSVL